MSEAFLAALSDWPKSGCPKNPEAWLITVARRKVIDTTRRQSHGDAAVEDLIRLTTDFVNPGDDLEIPDRRLALMFACAHPAIDASIRAPLMLQVVMGLDAAVIASAFLVSPQAMGKRLVRAKVKIKEAGIPLEVPERDRLVERFRSVLDGVYATYSAGWTDPGGTDLARNGLSSEAVFLARLTAELLPSEPEALGLLAFILYVEARRVARRSDIGEYVPLAEQDQSRWNWRLIAEAEDLLRRASALRLPGRYQTEAALQSAHVSRCRTGVALYDALGAIAPSPVVAINRALALAEMDGPGAGLAALAEAAQDERLAGYQPYWAARADLLGRTEAVQEACRAYDAAIGLERDEAVRAFLFRRRSGLKGA